MGFLFVVATVIFLWGIMLYVVGSFGEQKKLDDWKRMIAWGIIGLLIMASAWGIVKLLCGFFETCTKINI